MCFHCLFDDDDGDDEDDDDDEISGKHNHKINIKVNRISMFIWKVKNFKKSAYQKFKRKWSEIGWKKNKKNNKIVDE